MKEEGQGERDRSRAAFEQLYRDNAEGVFLFFFKDKQLSRDDSKDLRQETFRKAFQSWSSFRGDSKPRTWLRGIASNVWRDRVEKRSAAKRSAQEMSLEDPRGLAARQIGSGETPLDDQLIEKQHRAKVHDVMEALPERQQACLRLQLEGLTNFQIGRILGISTGTVKSQLSKARAKLRKELASSL